MSNIAILFWSVIAGFFIAILLMNLYEAMRGPGGILENVMDNTGGSIMDSLGDAYDGRNLLGKVLDRMVYWFTLGHTFRAGGKNYAVIEGDFDSDGPWTGYKAVVVNPSMGMPGTIHLDQAIRCRAEGIPLERCLERPVWTCVVCGGHGDHHQGANECEACIHGVRYAVLSASGMISMASAWRQMFGTEPHQLDASAEAPILAGASVSVRADGTVVSSDGQPIGFALDVPTGDPVDMPTDVPAAVPAAVPADVPVGVPEGVPEVHPLDASMSAGAHEQERQAGDDLVMAMAEDEQFP